ncbi:MULTISPECIES: hypothetical protein [Pectobacterium]|uniref:hypothetical protein n=1 Tax=Pectobacterium TaxID=122277 RepID=UPI000B0354F2|nr:MULTISPECIES: hypothetical protein [Pectobacterium]MBA0187170.1 hypothetical protein [Pectobacterium odoriferum]MCA6962958.1 hypothetical protein [Pectobacterium odoriferum]MCH5011046.1 hypothetical protein [Pectobacterium odoriferum]
MAEVQREPRVNPTDKQRPESDVVINLSDFELLHFLGINWPYFSKGIPFTYQGDYI